MGVSTVAVPNVVEVRGVTQCPRAGDVAVALEGLLPLPEGEGKPDVALVRDDGDLVVELRSASGELIGEKRIGAALACGVRAATAAVFVAAWESRLAEVRARPLAVPDLPQGRMPDNGSLAVQEKSVSVQDRPFELRPAATVLGAYAAADPAFGAALEVVGARADSALRGGAALLYVGEHPMAVGAGTASWKRFGAGLDARWRFSGLESPVQAEARAGAIFALVDLEGHGYSSNQSGWVADVGPVAGLRLAPRQKGFIPFFELATAWWPWPHRASIVGQSDFGTLPRFELFAGVGVSFERNR